MGYSYESPNQKDPVYDAKGIETVRRDGCPAVGKVVIQQMLALTCLIIEKYLIWKKNVFFSLNI